MSRQRMTWGGDGRPAPTRRASAHPAVPWEGETHPAAYPDPEADAYENGDPSSWAEDPHPPPYRTSVAPAVPYDDGGYRHPATQPGAPAKNASVNVRVAAERKAAKCIRIATALLGPGVAAAAQRGDKVATDLIEDQALDFMDLSDARIANTLLRLEASTEDEETLLRKMLAAEGGEGDEAAEEEEEAPAQASKKAAEGDLMAAIQSLKAEIESIKAGKHLAEEPPVMAGRHMAEDDDEALLAQMLREEKMGYGHMAEDVVSEEDAMLAEMLKEAEKAPAVAPPMAATVAPPMAAAVAPPMAEDSESDTVMGGFEDPMAMGDEADAMDADEEAILASLFASRSASEGDESAEDEEAPAQASEEEEEVVETASKKAALRPQPKKASVGAKTIGSQTRVASGGDDLGDLARLWASAPDVRQVFGG